MADRCEWVEIVEPRSQEHMYANLTTGECAWHPPPGIKIKKTSDVENQWWELFDKKTSRFYYYNASSQKTVWHRPQTGDIIPLAKLQTMKSVSDGGDGGDGDDGDIRSMMQPIVQREISTQTPMQKKESSSKRQSSAAGTRTTGSGRLPGGVTSTGITSGRSTGGTQVTTSGDQTSPQQSRKQSRSSQQSGRRTHPTPLDKYREDPEMSNVSTNESVSRDREVSSHSQRDDVKIPDNKLSEPGRTKSGVRRGASQVSSQLSSRPEMISPGPQRTLESPLSRHLASQHVPRDVTIDQPSQSQNSRQNHGSYFQRQDSYPMMRDTSSRVNYSRDLVGYGAGQYQDVSQITAVQVTPRPKPRAFPRTNPSYVGSQRRDAVGPSSASFRHNDGVPASAFNQGYQSTRHGGGDGTNQASSRYYPGAVGSQTLQVSHSYYGGSDGVRRSTTADNDSDSSHCSSSSSESSVNNGVRRQYTLDSRPVSRHFGGRSGVASSFHVSSTSNAHQRPMTATAGMRRVEQHTSDNGASSDNSPVIGRADIREPSRRTERRTRRDPDIPPRNSVVVPNGSIGQNAAPLHSPARRNSEPDYVNVPPGSKTESLRSASRDASANSSQKSITELTKSVSQLEPSRVSDNDVDGTQNGGTLRIRDHHAPADYVRDRYPPADYVNCDELYMNSSNYYNAQHNLNGYSDDFQLSLGDQSYSSSSAIRPSTDVIGPSNPSLETHHPSLRRRKWIDKPGASLAPSSVSTAAKGAQVRQSTLEKTLSLQAELQQRPLSMVVPYGSGATLDPSNAIINQVADTLLHQMDIERFLMENLNEHRKGILGKTVPVDSMLIWTKDLIQKPMIKTESKIVKKEALEVFKLIQSYMGDRKLTKDMPASYVAFDVVHRGWSITELRDEIFIQICRQTRRNPRDDSLLHGWELLGICLSFFPPSTKFQSYLESHIFRCLDTRDHTENSQLHRFASSCMKRLERIIEKQDLCKPSVEEIEHSKRSLLQPSMFGGTLEEIMDLQKERLPNSRLPWIQTALSEELLQLCGNQLMEGIFRVPGDSDEVSTLKSRCDQWCPPGASGSTSVDPHIVASLLKLWYRELHEPLIPREFYAECVEAYSNPQSAVEIVSRLPHINRLVLTYLIRFLQKFAAPENAAVTKMDANNLAMVMAPNCLRCDSDDPQVMFDNARKEMGFIRTLIQHLDTSDVEGVV